VAATAGSHLSTWLLWGGLGLAFVVIYMAVYFLIRVRWGHRRWSDARPDPEDRTPPR
jgi:hypothetical protein